MTQLDGRNAESTDLEPVSLSLPVLKELGAKWLVQMTEYFADNPQMDLSRQESQQRLMAKRISRKSKCMKWRTIQRMTLKLFLVMMRTIVANYIYTTKNIFQTINFLI